MKILAVFILCNCFSYIYSARILGVLHVPTTSHNQIGVVLLNGLAERGHQVTILSALDPKLNNSNVRYIYLDGMFKPLEDQRHGFHSLWTGNTFSFYKLLTVLSNSLTYSALKSNAMENLMKSGEEFDIVFIEPFLNQALVGLGKHFNAQIVVLSTSNSFLANVLSGNIAPYSFVPNAMSSLTDRMNFQERFYNTIQYFYFHIAYKMYNEPFQEKLYKDVFPQAPDYHEATKNVSLHLVNAHVVFESPRPYLPSMIPIGGLHLKPPNKLSKNIQEYLDNANQGAILFSLGSYIQSRDITDDKRKAILNTFAKIPQKILWKFEEDLPEKPDNVIISKWLPQDDILAHPNLKLFISHCGLLSSVEAVYRGVPVLGIPFFADQFNNIAQFEVSGYGQRLLYHDLTEETFTAKIQEILSNSSYGKNIKRASQILRDQPMTPLDRAIFWTEHIIKYGPSHLRPASLDLNIFEFLLLDIVAFVIMIILFASLAMYLIVKYILTKLVKGKHHKAE